MIFAPIYGSVVCNSCCGSNNVFHTGYCVDDPNTQLFKCTACSSEWQEYRPDLNIYENTFYSILGDLTSAGFLETNILDNHSVEIVRTKTNLNLLEDEILKIQNKLKNPMSGLKFRALDFSLKDNNDERSI